MQKLHEVALSPAAGAGNKRAGRAASRIIALALGLLAPAVAAADYLIIEGGSGASADTHTLDGTPGALAADNIQGAGEDFVAITASGRGNVVDNYGKVNGPAQAAPGAGLTIVNHAGATLGPGATGNAVQAMVAEDEAAATNYNYVDLVLDNSGTISGGVVGRGTLQLVNRGTMNGRDSGAAVNLNAGRGTLDNSGAINAGAEGVAIYNGFLIANDEEGEGNDVVRTAPTLDLYHRANGAINGDVVNHGTLNVKRFDGQMTGDIVNLGTLDVGEQKVAFTGAYASAENLDGDDEAAVTGRSTVKFAIANGKHGALRALSGGGADSGKVDLSHTDVVVTARGGIAGDRYRLVDAAKGIKVLDTANDGEGDNAETVTSSARIILNRNSLTLDYNYILHSGTDSQGYLDVAAVARPRAFHDNSNERDRDMADVLDAVAPAVPDSMRAMMWRLNTIRTSPEMRRALESVNNRSASSAMGQLSATAVAAHLNATKSLFRELGSNQLAVFSRGTAARASAGGAPVAECAAASGSATPAGDYYCWNAFGRLYGSFGYQEESADMAGYDLKTAGVLAGLDYAFARELRAGVLGGFSYNTSELGRHLGDNTDLMTRLGLYGCFNWDGLYVDVSPTFGLHRLKSERRIHIDDWSARAENERWAWDLNLLVNAGVTINLPGRTYFTPEFSIAPGVFHSPDYEESGAADNFNLRVDAQTNWSLLQTLGFRLGTIIDLGCGTQLKPEFALAWEHEYLDTAGETTNAFVAAPDRSWRNVLNGISRERLLLSLGLSALVMDDLSLYLRWDQRIWEDGYTCSFSAGAAYGF